MFYILPLIIILNIIKIPSWLIKGMHYEHNEIKTFSFIGTIDYTE